MKNIKQKIDKIRSNTNLDMLQIRQKRAMRRLLIAVKNHKLISVTVISLIIFSLANIIMIYQFMKILQNI